DGTRRRVGVSAAPVRDARGHIVGVATIGGDVTSRNAAEKALRDAKERFAGAFDNAAIGMALVSLGGGFLQVNLALCRMTGYSEDELLASDLQRLAHPEAT